MHSTCVMLQWPLEGPSRNDKLDLFWSGKVRRCWLVCSEKQATSWPSLSRGQSQPPQTWDELLRSYFSDIFASPQSFRQTLLPNWSHFVLSEIQSKNYNFLSSFVSLQNPLGGLNNVQWRLREQRATFLRIQSIQYMCTDKQKYQFDKRYDRIVRWAFNGPKVSGWNAQGKRSATLPFRPARRRSHLTLAGSW